MGEFFNGSYFAEDESPCHFADPTAALDAATGDSVMARVSSCDVFMLYGQGHYSTSLLSREHAEELAKFILDATGVGVKVKQVRIGFDICHDVNIAQGWVDDSQILQAKADTDYWRLLQEAEAPEAAEAEA